MLSTRANDNDILDFHFYYYHPSMAAAIIFIVLFGLATSFHFFQMLRSQTWFMVPFLIGGIFESVGYVGRALSAAENPGPYTKVPYIIQSLLLLVAPALFAASIYMHLGRVVHMADADNALFISRRWLTKAFVTGDVLSFLIQGSGGGFLASGSSSKISLGKSLILAGLGMQLAFFGLFVVTAAVFEVKLARSPTARSQHVPWRRHLRSLYAVSALILVRSIVRIVEYTEGYSGYIMRHEIFLYLFDGLMMFTAMLVMNWIHPGQVAKLLRGGKSSPPSEESGDNVALRAGTAEWK